MKPSTTTQASSSTAAPSPSAGVPPRDFQCDHSGNDGWSLDFDGNSLPYEADHLLDSNGAWKFFGWSCGGWLPEESWNVPSDTWCPPEGLTIWDLAQVSEMGL